MHLLIYGKGKQNTASCYLLSYKIKIYEVCICCGAKWELL